MSRSEALPESNNSLNPTTARQRRLRANDKVRGVKHLKLRVTSAESDLIDSVRANMSMSRTEATMALFHEQGKRYGIDFLGGTPEVSSIKLVKGSEAINLLNELVKVSGSSANVVLTNALASYRHSFA